MAVNSDESLGHSTTGIDGMDANNEHGLQSMLVKAEVHRSKESCSAEALSESNMQIAGAVAPHGGMLQGSLLSEDVTRRPFDRW